MPNPFITNFAPAPGSVAGLDKLTRFSVRSTGTPPVDKDTIAAYMGEGFPYYLGGELPEDVENKTFPFEPWFGTAQSNAVRSIGPSGELIINKNVAEIQRAMYFLGGPESIADPDDPLMIEFVLELNSSELTPDLNDFTGVMFGLLINDTGLAVRFYDDGVGNRWIEIFDADYTATQRPLFPATTYRADYDWDGQVARYKLLWHPQEDLVELYLSSGLEDTATDTVLITGAVSDFSAANPIRTFQPWAFFGHGDIAPVGISRWHEAYLFDTVTKPIDTGIVVGGHTGFFKTNNQTDFDGLSKPEDADSGWRILPESYDTIQGRVFVEVAECVLERTSKTASYGYYRTEPKVTTPTVLDFSLRGQVTDQDQNSESSGIEVFIDDGTKIVRVGFLVDSSGNQYIGIYKGGDPKLISNYATLQTGWSAYRNYRLVYEPGVEAILSVLAEDEDEGGVKEALIVSVADIDLPVTESASNRPSPAAGFLHNSLISESIASMRLRRVRYSTNVVLLDSAHTTGWAGFGNGAATVENERVFIRNDSDNDAFFYFKDEAGNMDATKGVSLESRLRINWYTKGGVADPIRIVAGPSLGLWGPDGIFVLAADAGPGLGKILFLPWTDSLNGAEEDLQSIIRGEEEAQDYYIQVDWMEYHLYRMERTRGGQFKLFVDDVLRIELPERNVPTQVLGTGAVSVGLFSLTTAELEVEFLRYAISDGFDYGVQQKGREDRSDIAVDLIAVADDE